MNYKSITDSFKYSSSIIVINNNSEIFYQKDSDGFKTILSSLLKITSNSLDMPAYGVALNNDVTEAKKQGLWIELVFDKTQMFNEMPFDSLLIEVNTTYTGFNLMRKLNGVYSGRCFYLKLANNMTHLEETLNNLL